MTAKLDYAFGFHCDINHGFIFHGNKTVLFLSGQLCVFQNLEDNKQKFIPFPELQYPTALACGPKNFVAVADCGKQARVTMYDVESSVVKVMPDPEIKIQEYICMSFSSDFKYLAAQSGPPSWAMAVWAWDKKTLRTVYQPSQMEPNMEILEICFHPRDNDQIVAVGKRYFRLYKYEGDEEGFKHFIFSNYESENDLLSICWLPRERLAIGTANGKILMFDGIEQRYEIVVGIPVTDEKEKMALMSREKSKGDIETELIAAYPITFLCTTSEGLFCVYGNNVIIEYVRTDDNKDYEFLQSIHLPLKPPVVQIDLGEVEDVEDKITYIDLNGDEDILAACTDRGQIFQCKLEQTQVKKSSKRYFEIVTQPSHKEGILAMDICMKRPMIVSCSRHTVIFWDYVERKSEMRKRFYDEVLSVALHPLGLYIIIGFTEYARIFTILIDGLMEIALIKVKNCTQVSFSHSGHLLAIANGSRIEIYDFITMERFALFTGHPGKLTSFGWNESDTILISCDDKGAIYIWDLILKERITENVVKGTSYSDVAVCKDAREFYAVGSDMTIRHFMGYELQKEAPTGIELTSLSLSNRGHMLFGATLSGSLRVFRFPLTAAAASVDIGAHLGKITQLKVAIGDECLVTAGKDGMIGLWKIIEKGKKETAVVKFSTAVLIDREILDQHFALIKELETRLNKILVESQYQLSLKDMYYKQQMKSMSDNFETQISTLNSNIQKVAFEKASLLSKHQEEAIRLKEAARNDLNELERSTREKLRGAYDHEDEVMRECHVKEQSLRDEIKTLKSKHQKEDAALIDSYKRQLMERDKVITEQNEKIQQREIKNKELWEQVEDEVDVEIMEVKSDFSRNLQIYKEEVERLKEANEIAKKKIATQGKEIENFQEMIKQQVVAESKLKTVISELESEIRETQDRVQNKNSTIQTLQDRLFNLNQKKHELQKHEYVASFCYDFLKKGIEPRDEQIASDKKHIVTLCNGIEKLEKAAVMDQKEIKTLNDRLRAAEKDMKKEREKQQNLETLMERFQADLFICGAIIQEPHKLKNYVKQLMKKHLKEFKKETVTVDFNLNTEFILQREHLEKSIDVLRKRLLKENKTHRVEYVKMVQENSQLIQTINNLRQDLKMAQRRIHDMEAALGLTATEFSAEGSATRQKLETVVQSIRKNEEKVLDELLRKDKLIQVQQEELRRLQVLAVVNEDGKKVE